MRQRDCERCLVRAREGALEAAHHFALDRLTTEPSHALREHDDGIKIELPPGNLARPR